MNLVIKAEVEFKRRAHILLHDSEMFQFLSMVHHNLETPRLGPENKFGFRRTSESSEGFHKKLNKIHKIEALSGSCLALGVY